MTANPKKPLIPYVRQSRKKEQTISLDEQLRSIKAWAKSAGVKLAPEVVEQGISGSKSWRDRELGEAVAACERGEAAGIIVAWQDRLSREQGIATAEVWDALAQVDARLVVTEEGLDTATGDHELNFSIKAAIARDQWKRHRANWQKATRNAVVRGVYIASRVPTGYQRGQDGRLEPDPIAAPVVRELFLRRARGASWSELGRFLEASGVKSPYGSPSWAPNSAAHIVRNVAYLGIVRHGELINNNGKGEGDLAGVDCKPTHDPIVTQAEWDAANVRNGRAPEPGRAVDALLSGLLRCAGCRYVMKVDKMPGHKDGERLRTYRCRGKHAAGKCDAQAFSLARVIEPHVERVFLDALEGDGPLAVASQNTDELEAATAEFEEAQAQLEAYVESADALDVDLFKRGLTARQKRLAQAQERRDELLERTAPITALRGNLRERWPELTTAQKRELLTATIDAVVLRRTGDVEGTDTIEGRSVILWRGEMPDDFPRRGKRPPLAGFDIWDKRSIPIEDEDEYAIFVRD